MIAGMLLGLIAVVATYVAAAVSGVHLSFGQWIGTGLTAWLLASAVFTTLGLMMGYMVPGDNAVQVTSFVIVVLSFLGGLFYPLNQMPEFLQTLATYTPVYGISVLARAPITGDSFDIWALVNALVWFAIFLGGTVFFFRRDTKRM
jgi:ABC-2 type transport system permease protein